MYGLNLETLYLKARHRGRLGQVWSRLNGHSRGLIPLSQVEEQCTVRDRHFASIRAVSIDRIRGSESRCADFDRDFRPLQGHSHDRWLRVARARQADKPLPPVELVQVADIYFVLDGHHCLSVARTIGQQIIEAEVTVWQVSGALPWEGTADASGREQSGWYSGALRDKAHRLGEWVLVGLRGLVPAALKT
jgi:hypothetical protein